MKTRHLLSVLLLFTLLLPYTLTACTPKDDTAIIGRWRMLSYVTDDGQSVDIAGNELDMIFYSTGIGEAEANGQTQYMFNYTARGGKLERVINRTATDVQTVKETYKISSDGWYMTVYSPEEKATIELELVLPEPAKPVIYLYPQAPTEVEVKLDFNGALSCTYPEYKEGWKVTAYPDGTLIDTATGREYSYLFWEGVSNVPYDMSRGFVVKGQDTATFLQNILSEMGLTPREYNEFIVYWLPQMQNNAYNLITFQTDVYTKNAKLTITPKPDSMLRVFMAYKALEEPIEIGEPVIEPFVRQGFCVVEWGGAEIH